MVLEREIDLQHRTIIRLIRENESLHGKMNRNRRESSRRAENIVQEAMAIMDNSRSPSRSIGDLWRARATEQLAALSSSIQDENRIKNTDSQWLRENGSYVPRPVDFSLLENASRVSDVEHKFLPYSTLHSSALQPEADSTSRWLSDLEEQSRLSATYNRDEISRYLELPSRLNPLPESPLPPLKMDLSVPNSSLRPKGEFVVSTLGDSTRFGNFSTLVNSSLQPPQRTVTFPENEETQRDPASSIEGNRDPSPAKPVDDVFRDFSILDTLPSSGVSNSSLIHKEPLPCGQVKYTVWDIPNDRYLLKKGTFFAPNNASTPNTRGTEGGLSPAEAGSTLGSTILEEQTLRPQSTLNDEALNQLKTPPNGLAETKGETSSAGHSRGDIKRNRRVLGEIAFQLDRRIISYVFKSQQQHEAMRPRKRLYGYSVQNIENMMHRSAINPKSGRIDRDKLAVLQERFTRIKRALRPLGYIMAYHGEFAMDMVNKYGLLPLRPGYNSKGCLDACDAQGLHEVVTSLATCKEQRDMTILVDCLALLSQHDGRPMIYW